MSVGDIQAFLVGHGSVLPKVDPSQLGDGANGRSAAQIIYDAARTNRTDFASGGGFGPSNPLVLSLNPQVILATLQKEQSLITGAYVPGSPSTSSALNTALGMGCPDGGGCSATYAGFTNQVTYGAAQLMTNYYRAGSSSFKPGQTYTITNTTGGPQNPAPSQSVYIGNASTSSLYQYTPHVYNGNYNFWYYMNLWFSDTVNSISTSVRLIKGVTTDAVFAYVPGLNKRAYVQDLATIKAWGITAPVETWPDEVLAAVPGGIGSLSRLQKGSDSNVWYLEGGTRYHIRSDAQFPQYGVDWSMLAQVDDSLLNQLHIGPPLGGLARSNIRPEVYMMSNGLKYYVPDWATAANWGYGSSNIDVISQWQLDVTPTGPNLNVLAQIAGAPEVYAIANGKKYHIASLGAFQNWGFSFGNVLQLGKEMPPLLGNGTEVTRVVKGGGPAVYYIENGKRRHVISASRLSSVSTSMAELSQIDDNLINLLPQGPDL